MSTHALILAGGGLAGIAWETGILQGIADEAPATAQALLDSEILVGTSAGSFVGARLAMGADTVQTPYAYMAFSKTFALSRQGRIRPFDAKADGYAALVTECRLRAKARREEAQRLRSLHRTDDAGERREDPHHGTADFLDILAFRKQAVVAR